MLGDESDVQDAFQATFLTLVRRSRTLWICDSPGRRDGRGADGGPIIRAWNIQGFPTSFALDHRGVRQAEAGITPGRGTYDELVDRLLKAAETDVATGVQPVEP